MTFRDYANHYLVEGFKRLHDEQPEMSEREYLAAFADIVTRAASDLSGKVAHLVPGFGVEVDVASDYDPAVGILIADVHLRMIGTAPYSASAVFLQHGFTFMVDDAAYHTGLRVPMDSLRVLRG